LGTAKLEVFWEGTRITFQKKLKRFVRRDGPDAHRVFVDCVFLSLKTRCFRSGPMVKNRGYGTNLKYASPIASPIPILDYLKEAESRDFDNEWHLAAKHMSTLAVLTPRSYSAEGLRNVPEVHAKIGIVTEDTAYFEVSDVIGGTEAVAGWKSLIGRLPQRQECDNVFPCSVVLSGRLGNWEVIAYCSIMKSNVGVGTPYNCSVPVIVSGDKVYVLSYAGPEQCECGAVAGASCSAVSEINLEEAVATFVAEMKVAKTNIDMVAIKRSDDEYTLSGRHVGRNSNFFLNYFEKAYAYYKISVGKDGRTGKRNITVEGLYNLLISAEPSPDSKDYRDFGSPRPGESYLAWFQEQILDIIRKRVMSKIGGHVDCDVINID
jgi:hypothetical protein